MKELTKDQIFEAIDKGEFSDEVIGHEKVAVIMTQAWCPQWHAMERWINEVEIPVFVVVYDGKDYGEDFMHFKEREFKNDQIPYIRYYKAGKLIAESNYVPKEAFMDNF